MSVTRGFRTAGGRCRRLHGVVGVVVVAGLVLGGLAMLADEGTTPTLPKRAGPAAYRVLYRVEVHQQPPSVTFEERIVRRPFDGRLLAGTTSLLDRASPDTSGTVGVGAAVYSVSRGELTLVQRRVPASAIGDQSLPSVLDEAVDAGLAERLEPLDTVLDRRCRQFAVREPGARILSAPTDESRATICIDDAGFVLRERWELRGELVLERTAVEVDAAPTEATVSEALDVVGSAGPPTSGPSVRAVDRLDSFLREPAVPEGFRLAGRYQSATIDQAFGALQSSSWVMSRGGDFVVVEAGTGPIRLDDGLRTISAAGGTGMVYIGWSGSEVRIAIDDRRWVRVTSSAPSAWLEEYVDTLRLAA